MGHTLYLHSGLHCAVLYKPFKYSINIEFTTEIQLSLGWNITTIQNNANISREEEKKE